MSNPISIIITGANGRMGQTLIRLIAKKDDLLLVGATEQAQSPAIGADAGINVGTRELGVKIGTEMTRLVEQNPTAPVIIDFTTPTTTSQNVKTATQHGFAMVIGTTGLSETQTAEIMLASKKIPIVLAPNMSVGMNLIFSLLKDITPVLKNDYDIEIFEAHHKDKKDAPSGTANKIAQILCEAAGLKYPDAIRHSRQGTDSARSKNEIGMQVLRGGDIVGDHTVFFCGEGERIEIKHSVSSRTTFALGAIRAAKWLSQKPAGLYTMQDVLLNTHLKEHDLKTH